MSRAVPDPSEFICFAVYSTNHAFSRVYKPLLEKLGVTYPQYLVLATLWSRGDQTVGGLGDVLLLEYSTLTPLLKRLEKQGLVTRSRDPDDERQVHIHLTRQGAALREKARDFSSCVDGATGLSPEALTKLRVSIESVRTALLEASE